MEQLDFEGIVFATLQSCGWSASKGWAIATKPVKTAVGEKDAAAYLADYGPQEPLALSGDYYSEGRNALGSAMVLLPRDANREQLEALVKKFAESADSLIDNTYAVRLLKSNPRLVEQALA